MNNLCKWKIVKMTFYLFRYILIIKGISDIIIKNGVLDLTSVYQRTSSKRNIIMFFLNFIYIYIMFNFFNWLNLTMSIKTKCPSRRWALEKFWSYYFHHLRLFFTCWVKGSSIINRSGHLPIWSALHKKFPFLRDKNNGLFRLLSTFTYNCQEMFVSIPTKLGNTHNNTFITAVSFLFAPKHLFKSLVGSH